MFTPGAIWEQPRDQTESGGEFGWAAHLLNNNAGVQRWTQWERNLACRTKGKAPAVLRSIGPDTNRWNRGLSSPFQRQLSDLRLEVSESYHRDNFGGGQAFMATLLFGPSMIAALPIVCEDSILYKRWIVHPLTGNVRLGWDRRGETEVSLPYWYGVVVRTMKMTAWYRRNGDSGSIELPLGPDRPIRMGRAVAMSWLTGRSIARIRARSAGNKAAGDMRWIREWRQHMGRGVPLTVQSPTSRDQLAERRLEWEPGIVRGKPPFHSFHSIPFHFHSISISIPCPFHSCCPSLIPFHSIPFHSIPSIPFHFHSIQNGQSIPFHSIPSIPFHSIPFHSRPFIPFHSIPFEASWCALQADQSLSDNDCALLNHHALGSSSAMKLQPLINTKGYTTVINMGQTHQARWFVSPGVLVRIQPPPGKFQSWFRNFMQRFLLARF